MIVKTILGVAATSFIPEAINRVFAWWDDEPEPKPKKHKKRHDCNKVTVKDFRIINTLHNNMVDNNRNLKRKDKMQKKELTKQINEKLGYNKTSYSRYYDGTVKEEDCVKGED